MNFELFKDNLKLSYWTECDEALEVEITDEVKLIFEKDAYEHDTLNIVVNIICSNGDVYQPIGVDNLDMQSDVLLANLYKMVLDNMEYILQRSIVKDKLSYQKLSNAIQGMNS